MLTKIHFLTVGIREFWRLLVYFIVYKSDSANSCYCNYSRINISIFHILLNEKTEHWIQCYFLRDRCDGFRRLKINITYVMIQNLCIYVSKVLHDYHLIFLYWMRCFPRRSKLSIDSCSLNCLAFLGKYKSGGFIDDST